MLKTRVLTATVLFIIAFAAFATGSKTVICLLALAALTLAAWEWARLTTLTGFAPVAVAIAFVVVAVGGAWLSSGDVFTFVPLTPVAGIATACWTVLAPIALFMAPLGTGVVSTRPPAWWSVVGIAVLAVAWWSFCAAATFGWVFLVSVLAIIWCSDIAAYFTGRAFGRRKLAPRISPGKTWEGVAGAVGITLLLCGLVASFNAPGATGFIGALWHAWPWPIVLIVLAFLVALGIVGDLFESMLKRRAGVKDSSRLLPGHGGLFDRFDAVLPVFPAAMWLFAWATGS
ncbi:phosphatidate cytidylyltransferase [soil metagenome]